jgi:hypothetical protein
MLVAALGKDWGAYRKAAGKVVWVIVQAELQSMQHSAASDESGDL